MPRPNVRSGNCGANLPKNFGAAFQVKFHGNPGHNCTAGVTKIRIDAVDRSGSTYRWEGTCTTVVQPYRGAGPRNERLVTFEGTCTDGIRPAKGVATSTVGDLIVMDVTVSNGAGPGDQQTLIEMFDL